MGILANGVNVYFGKGGDTLYKKDVDFRLAPSQRVVICGPSGSGKTVFMKMLSYLMAPSYGEVSWPSGPVKSCHQANKLRSNHISMIHSTFFFLEGLSIRDNVMLPALFAKINKKTVMKRYNYVRELLDFGAEVDNNPMGFLTLGELERKPLEALSNGQKEIVSIARCMMLDVDYIFADELLRSFNFDAEQQVWSRVKEHIEGSSKALLLITHKEYLRHDSMINNSYYLSANELIPAED